MATRRRWTIWGVLGLVVACNTFDDSPDDDSEPRNLLPTGTIGVIAGMPAPFPSPRPAGTPAPPPIGFGAAGVAGMPPVRWQPIDAGPPSADADGGADDAGSSKR